MFDSKHLKRKPLILNFQYIMSLFEDAFPLNHPELVLAHVGGIHLAKSQILGEMKRKIDEKAEGY
jgi:hypothetical protein